MLNKHRDLPTVSLYPLVHGDGGVVDQLRERIAANLRRLIRELRLNQSQVAEDLGLSQGSISGWITMRDWPSSQNLSRFCEKYGIDPEELTRNFKRTTPAPANEEQRLLRQLRIALKQAGYELTKKD